MLAVGASLGGLLVLLEGATADARVLVNPMPPAGLPAEPSLSVIPWRQRASLAQFLKTTPFQLDGSTSSADAGHAITAYTWTHLPPA